MCHDNSPLQPQQQKRASRIAALAPAHKPLACVERSSVGQFPGT
jgi:hypothetical protein